MNGSRILNADKANKDDKADNLSCWIIRSFNYSKGFRLYSKVSLAHYFNRSTATINFSQYITPSPSNTQNHKTSQQQISARSTHLHPLHPHNQQFHRIQHLRLRVWSFFWFSLRRRAAIISLTSVKKASSTPCFVFADVSMYGMLNCLALSLPSLVETSRFGRSTLFPTSTIGMESASLTRSACWRKLSISWNDFRLVTANTHKNPEHKRMVGDVCKRLQWVKWSGYFMLFIMISFSYFFRIQKMPH